MPNAREQAVTPIAVSEQAVTPIAVSNNSVGLQLVFGWSVHPPLHSCDPDCGLTPIAPVHSGRAANVSSLG